MTPHLVKWHEQFADQGLVIIEVDHGGIDQLADLEEHVAEAGIKFPVLHDASGRICGEYGARTFPTAYLINREGEVVWEGHPVGDRQIANLKSVL